MKGANFLNRQLNYDVYNTFYRKRISIPIFNLRRERTGSAFLYSGLIMPASLISYGIIARNSKFLRRFDVNAYNFVCEKISGNISLDDYAQFAPAVSVYGLGMIGMKAKHGLRDRTIVMATSHLIMAATVKTMKHTISVRRPDNSNNESFPSGHTATAFVGAHILFREYKDVSPWIGIGGYAVATATGTLRVVNRKHWVSDVVTGAGIGLFSAEMGYMLSPVFHNIFRAGSNHKSWVITPALERDNYGVDLSCQF
jgi:membrane-associated phospholipid phosphatase